MPDINVASAVHTFMQSADQAAMRTNIGVALTQTGSAALQQTGNYTVTLAGTGAVTLTLPSTSGTLATQAGTETLTNKSLTAPTLTSPAITSNGLSILGSSSGATTLKAAAAASGTMTIPAGTDTLVSLTGTQTLTNKTFVTPILGSATCSSINGVQIATGGSAPTLTFDGDITYQYTDHLEFVTSAATQVTLPAGNTTLYGTGSSTITSLQLKTSMSDETGSGALVFANSPTLVTPVIGVAYATTLTVTGDIECSDISAANGGTIPALLTNSIAGAGASVITMADASIRQKVSDYSSNGAILLISGIHTISKGSAAAMTVAAPSSQNGERLTIVSTSNFAHVITFTGTTLYDGTTGANSTVTFAAFIGASVTFIAVGSIWVVESSNQATIAP
jgi:hypothetical protein